MAQILCSLFLAGFVKMARQHKHAQNAVLSQSATECANEHRKQVIRNKAITKITKTTKYLKVENLGFLI